MAIEAGVPAVDGDKPAASGAPASGFFGRIQSILEGVARRLENPKVEYALWGGLLLALIAFVVIRPIYPNYDTMYALVWGDQIAHGHLPDYSVFKTPTPHPLFNVYTAILSLTGNAAIWILLGLSLLMYVGLLMGVYRLVQMKIGTLVAAVTVVVLLTRTDLMAFAFRSMLDIPFLALIVWAAVLELKKPRRGTAPLVLLMLAGLLRPEAWLLAGLYWLWLAAGVVKPQLQLPGETPSHGKLAGYAGLVVAAPVIWLGCDWIVTGDPMYSLTSTRQVAGELGRQKSLGKSITLLPHYSGGSEHIVNPYVGFLGFAFAVYLLRSRMLMLTGLALAGILTYLLIAIAGLSVIPRYLMLPSLVACIGVAFCLVGWVGLTGAARKVGIGLAILALAVIGVRSTAYLHEGQQLNTSTLEASVKFDRINRILEGRKLAPALKTCLPVISPTHEAVPVIRYRLGLAKEQVLSSTQTESVPKRGIQLLPTGYLVPLGMTSVDKVLRKPWTNFAYPGFVYQGENRAWVAYTSCRATG